METVKFKIQKLLAEPFSGHPSREDEFKTKDALLLLAEEIDRLRESHTSGRV